jgi:hypothetical protein
LFGAPALPHFIQARSERQICDPLEVIRLPDHLGAFPMKDDGDTIDQ